MLVSASRALNGAHTHESAFARVFMLETYILVHQTGLPHSAVAQDDDLME